MPESRSVVIRLSADASQAIAGLQAVSREADRSATQMEAAGRKQEQAIDRLGTTAGKAGAVAAAGLVAAGKAAMDWESQFAGVRKTVDGTAEQISTLEGELREMARTMPATHQEIAATAEAAGQLGVATEDVSEFTRVMVMMGETTNLSADEAATSLAQFMNVMGTSGDRVDEIANTIVDLGNKGASTEAQIVAMAQRVSGAGALIGASESDVLALSAAMANLGIESELGGGAVQRVLVGINSEVASGGPKLQQYADLAKMSAAEFAAAWGNDPVRAFDALLQGLGGVQASGGDVAATLEDLGIKGTQNLQVMLRLAGAGDTLTTALDQSGEAWSENSALLDEFAQRAGTTAAEAQVAWNNIKDAGIDAGAVLLPVVSEVADGISAIAQAFQVMPDPVQEAVVALGAVVAITGGAAWFGSKVVGGVRETTAALEALGIKADTTSGRIRGVAKATAALAAATATLEYGAGVWDSITRSLSAGDQAVETIEGLEKAFADSNVGKFAQDLGIDVRRLAEDLAMSGTEGTYYQDVLEQLGSASDGLGGKINRLTDFLGPWIGDTEQAGLASLDLGKIVRANEDELAALAAEIEATTGASGRYTSATVDAGNASRTSAAEIARLTEEMLDNRDATLGAFDAETRWRQALVDAREQAARNSAGIQGNSEAALENRDVLSALASAWNDQSAAVRNSEGRFRAARSVFIETAEGMGVSRQAARDLADQLLALPKSKTIPVAIDGMSTAMQQLQAIRSELDSLDGSSATVTVRRVNAGGMGPQVTGYAAGGTVRRDAPAELPAAFRTETAAA